MYKRIFKRPHELPTIALVFFSRLIITIAVLIIWELGYKIIFKQRYCHGVRPLHKVVGVTDYRSLTDLPRTSIT